MADPTDHPLFDKAAEQTSKNYIFLFMCTSVALMIFSDARPGWLFGIGFLVVGMFAVSVIVALPMFWIRFQILPTRIRDMPIEQAGPGFRQFIVAYALIANVLFSVLDLAVPIGVTWWSYEALFG